MPLHVIAFVAGCLVGGFVASWFWRRVAGRWKDLATDALSELEKHVMHRKTRASRMARRVEALYRAHKQSGEFVISVEASTEEEAWLKLIERG